MPMAGELIPASLANTAKRTSRRRAGRREAAAAKPTSQPDLAEG